MVLPECFRSLQPDFNGHVRSCRKQVFPDIQSPALHEFEKRIHLVLETCLVHIVEGIDHILRNIGIGPKQHVRQLVQVEAAPVGVQRHAAPVQVLPPRRQESDEPALIDLAQDIRIGETLELERRHPDHLPP